MTDGGKARIAILGASGYTGSELVRLLVRHPRVEIVALTADRKAGQAMADVFPQFAPLNLPKLITIEEVDWSGVDLAFCALPHGTTQLVIKKAFETAPHIKIVDLSADFRLRDPGAYEQWYGHAHQALELQQEAVYGIVELYRADIKKARLVANPGCFTTTAIMPVVPLIEAGAIEPEGIVIDAKSGVTGAGRSPKESLLYTEVTEGIHAYGVGSHRHMGELDQEFSKVAGRSIVPSFTPHLTPMNRGIYATIYAKTMAGIGVDGVHRVLQDFYKSEPFVHVLPLGQVPQSRYVKGSNMIIMGVVADRQPGRVIIIATLDNLVKGASGQAVQNMNVVLGYPETMGLEQVALFP